MAAVTIPYTVAQTAQIAPARQRTQGPLRVPTVVPAELSGPVTVRVPGRGLALYEISIGTPCSTDACYTVRVQAFPSGPVVGDPDGIREDLPDGGFGFYHLAEHFSTMLVTYPGQGYDSYRIDCTCGFDQLDAVARGFEPLPLY